jgi:FkbM family methyltransferase
VFEPNPACLDQIKRLTRPNMVIHPVGLSDAAADLTLRYDPGNTGIGTVEVANTLTQNASIRSIVQTEVRVQRLDDFGLTGVAFIKIDVEGHEAAVVRGAQSTIAASMPILLIESELRHNPDGFEQLFAVLAPMGYEARQLAGRAWQKVRPGDLAMLQVAGDGTANNFFFVPRNRLSEFSPIAA